MNRVISFGEVLEDYVLNDNNEYIKLVGGAPLNFLATCSKLDSDCYLITCLSNDDGSKRVFKMIEKENIHATYIKYDYSTILCHSKVSVDKITGEREFFFYKDNASFLSLNEEDIKEEYFKENDLFHCGSVCLLNENIYKAQLKAIKLAIKNNNVISFDPNFRPSLFKQEKQKKLVNSFLPYVDILKLSIDELIILTDLNNETDNINELFDHYQNLKMIFLTKGSDGISLYFRNREMIFQQSIKVEKMIDTIGCGDCSYGSFISFFMNNNEINKDNIDYLNKDLYKKALLKSCQVGALVCSIKGCLPLPDIK